MLPTLTLGLIFLAIYLRIMRASMLEVLNLDFVRTARAKGLDETSVVTRHVLRNALLPMVTLIGLQAGTMLGGSVVVESVFSLPGLGRLAYESVVQRDLNTLLGIVFVSALLVIVVNFVVDLAYARLDPRITRGRLSMDALRRYLRSPPAIIGLVLLLADPRDGGERRLALSARPAEPRRPAADLAVREPALLPRHRQFRPRHRGADLPRRALLAADRPGRDRDRGHHRHRDRRASPATTAAGSTTS